MGVVYEAEDTTLHRRVAVKLLNEALSDDDRFIERFRREARSSAALAHPNIASVFDYGQDGPAHFIVMELVGGKDLSLLLREEAPLSVERVIRIATQAAGALGHAHAADLVHRDVKPANIRVAEGDKVKVTDFGIARAGGDSTLTAIGSVLGTAHYISPEQAAGEPASPRSDVYSLGIVLYEMLTGGVPFTGENMVAIASRHASETVPRPSELRPEVSPALDQVVATATARNPLDRYPDGTALAAALRDRAMIPAATVELLAGEEATETKELRPVPLPTDRWNPQKVGRVVVGVAIVLLLLSVGGGLARFMGRDKPAAPVSQTTPTTQAKGVVVPQGLVGLPYEDAERLL
ncbi:MAG: eukaryotic-like serine/threonine-protein kinase, partial [Actinomycetota bacterium]|nr:eukaryotic-like serine/threonine-protein kinase [Actinomycetota bacterium]